MDIYAAYVNVCQRNCGRFCSFTIHDPLTDLEADEGDRVQMKREDGKHIHLQNLFRDIRKKCLIETIDFHLLLK